MLSYHDVVFQLEDMRVEISRREQEILQMATKMKTLEEQHQDYQKHIAVLKESLCAKEEHYTMLQTDVSAVHMQANRKVQSLLSGAARQDRLFSQIQSTSQPAKLFLGNKSPCYAMSVFILKCEIS